MADTRHDKQADTPLWQTPFRAPAVDEKPEPHEKTPAEKAADTRAKNKRAEARSERKAAKDAAEAALVSAERRTWSCPACGRGTTFPTVDGPDGAHLCQGCGVSSEDWLAPGMGHGEPELQVPPVR